jgi:hypothetical protein
MRGHENVAKRPCSAQTGWSKKTQTRIPKDFGKSTTPSAPSEDASRYFLDVASTPPHEEGIIRLISHTSSILFTNSMSTWNGSRDYGTRQTKFAASSMLPVPVYLATWG